MNQLFGLQHRSRTDPMIPGTSVSQIFDVNNPKTDDEIIARETIFILLTLFKGELTVANKFLCIFAADII